MNLEYIKWFLSIKSQALRLIKFILVQQENHFQKDFVIINLQITYVLHIS